MTLLERFLQILAKPNIAFILLTIGQYGIFAELIVPGFIGPGVVGVICLVLAFVGLGNLPVNLVAVGLLLFSMFLFFMELQQPGIGIFGISGLISFVMGAFFLFGDFGTPHIPKPVFRVSIWLIAVIAGILCAFLLSLIFFIRSVAGTRAQIGVPRAMRALVGQSGMVVSALSPSGTIRIDDQSWTATTTSDDLIPEGEEVIVVGVYGRVLKVSKVTKEG
jgi:membrane-bound serine protease (ClpP class)